MPERKGDKSRDAHRAKRLGRTIAGKEARKLHARRHPDQGIWFWLGTFGLVGWSVAIPTLIGVAVGVWIDRTWPSRVSWTLTLLFVGVCVGCMTAWYWLRKESGND